MEVVVSGTTAHLIDSNLACGIHLEFESSSGIDLNGLIYCDGLSASPTLALVSRQSLTWSTELIKMTHADVDVGIVIQEHSKSGVGRRWVSNGCHI
jgi:hypothetical protein